MRVLILGGTGLTGPHVVRRLHGMGHEITVFHRGVHDAALPGGVRRVLGEMAYPPASLREPAPDVAIHMWAMNAADTQAFLGCLRGSVGRIVAISSGDVYRAYGQCKRLESGPAGDGSLGENAPLRESRYPYRGMPNPPMDRIDEYDKLLVEQTLREQSAAPVTILRFPAVYGPGSHRFSPHIGRMLRGEAEIRIDEGFALWRWTHGYAEDVAEAVVLTATDGRAAGRTYNVGEMPTPPWAERLEELGRIAGWQGRVLPVPAANLPEEERMPFDFRYHLDTDTHRIRDELGYAETVPREVGIARTIEWERSAAAGRP